MTDREKVRAGSLLVATPALQDPHFRRTVVYVIANNDEGTVGVVLNRRSETAVATVLPTWSEYVTRPRAVFIGGPVGRDAALGLGVARGGVDPHDVDHLEPLAGRVVLADLDSDAETVVPQLHGLRIYVGHAGWGAGQLADEIAEDAWWVLPGLPTDLLAGPEVDLWFAVLRRQPLPLAFQAYHPGDLYRN